MTHSEYFVLKLAAVGTNPYFIFILDNFKKSVCRNFLIVDFKGCNTI